LIHDQAVRLNQGVAFTKRRPVSMAWLLLICLIIHHCSQSTQSAFQQTGDGGLTATHAVDDFRDRQSVVETQSHRFLLRRRKLREAQLELFLLLNPDKLLTG
jgi:hypothetical protein